MTKFLRLVLLLLLAVAAHAQTTTVSATLIDPSGQAWGNATFTATVISSLNPPVTFPGYNSFVTSISGSANGAGLFTVNVQRVANIYPANSTWQFCVVSGVTYTQKFCVNVPVGNAGQVTQDISAQINAVITTPVIPGGVSVRAYNDAEVIAVPGAIYFNTTIGNFRCYTTSWQGCGNGGSGFPTATDVAGGKGDGTGVPMPEKPISIVGSNGFVVCDEDYSQGRFDARCPIYAGGVYGPTPGAAWQAFSDALVCYQGITGKHARTSLPPGTFQVGTATHPTLKLPGGAMYDGGFGWGFGSNAVQFQSTYNNVTAVEFDDGLTSTTNCSDGVPHTSNLANGSYDGFSEHGCNQGGCVNVPGDNGNYPLGGPLQIGIVVNDAGSTVGAKSGIFANNNGADGVICNGQDAHCHQLGGAANNEYFYYGMDTPGQNYQFAGGECHGEVSLTGLDDMNPGPFETYGTFMTLGAEYGHIAGICWSGGITWMGPYFVQIEEIGIIHVQGGNTQTGASSGRIDAPRGTGILEMSNGATTWQNPRVIGACRSNPATSFFVGSVTTATPGSGQTPGTYLLTASSGSAQISVTVAAGGTVTTNPAVTIHGHGYTSAPPTFTLAAGGTPATFTVNMRSVFLHNNSGFNNISCSYITEQFSGNDTYISPSTLNNGFFGTDYSTGDFYTEAQHLRIIGGMGNGAGGKITIDPNFTLTNSLPTFFNSRMVDSDPIFSLGGFQQSGTVIDLSYSYHVALSNTSPTTLTAVTNGLMSTPIYITGDGFTTMPYVAGILGGGGVSFGANNCSGHPQLLLKDHRYTYEIVAGQVLGQPVVLNEQCGSIFEDYEQPGFLYLAANSALPPTTTQATLDAAGTIAVRAFPPMPAIHITTAGAGSSFSYCFVVEIWAAGGKQTTPLACTSVTPTVASGLHNVKLNLALPLNWTRYKIFMNSTTDPSFTPGVWYDVSAPNGLPQPSSCNFGTLANCGGGGNGLFITPFTPTDTSTIATANIGLNMTGTYNANLSSPTIPTTTGTLCVQGQQVSDVAGGFDYICSSEDHWVRSSRSWNTF